MTFPLARLRFAAWVVLALGVAALTSSGVALAQGKVLKFIPEADLRSLDPIWTTAYITRNHGYMRLSGVNYRVVGVMRSTT